MKFKIAFWLACVASLLIPRSALAQLRPRIVAVTHGQEFDPFWFLVRDGLETAGKKAGERLKDRG
jgi:ABC-type sugar transport system substrate-binding protein